MPCSTSDQDHPLRHKYSTLLGVKLFVQKKPVAAVVLGEQASVVEGLLLPEREDVAGATQPFGETLC